MLSQIKRTDSGILGLRENMSLESTMAFAQGLPLGDERALARALRDIPNPVARVLANPVTRQLTTTTPEEMPTSRAVSSALSNSLRFCGRWIAARAEDFRAGDLRIRRPRRPAAGIRQSAGRDRAGAHAEGLARNRLAHRTGPRAIPARRGSLSRRGFQPRRFPSRMISGIASGQGTDA